MSARGSIAQILTKTGMLVGALLVFTVLLAALPAHRAPAQEASSQESPTQAPEVDHGNAWHGHGYGYSRRSAGRRYGLEKSGCLGDGHRARSKNPRVLELGYS
jgi:hypothetical protein